MRVKCLLAGKNKQNITVMGKRMAAVSCQLSAKKQKTRTKKQDTRYKNQDVQTSTPSIQHVTRFRNSASRLIADR